MQQKDFVDAKIEKKLRMLSRACRRKAHLKPSELKNSKKSGWKSILCERMQAQIWKWMKFTLSLSEQYTPKGLLYVCIKDPRVSTSSHSKQ